MRETQALSLVVQKQTAMFWRGSHDTKQSGASQSWGPQALWSQRSKFCQQPVSLEEDPEPQIRFLSWLTLCSLGKPWAEDPVYPCLSSWLMETDIIDGCCSKLLNCGNLWCSNRKLIQPDFNYHQMTHKFIYPARPSLAYPTVYLTSSRGCLEGTSVSVCSIRLMSIRLEPSSVNSIYHPSS